MIDYLRNLRENLREKLLAAWPFSNPATPEIAGWLGAWWALMVWGEAGEGVCEIRGDESPIVDPDLELANAPLQREGQCFTLEKEKWIVLARVPAKKRFLLGGPHQVTWSRSPLLVWATEIDRHLAAGRFALDQMPRVRDLRITSAYAITRTATVPRDGRDASSEGVILARVLPLFLEPPQRQ